MNSRKSLFLADDDEDDLSLFEEALREVCLETTLTTASDGDEILEILDKFIPPPAYAIILDLNMPKRTGFECLREIKKVAKLKDIPVFILSTSVTQEAMDKTYSAGAHYYITKPSTFAGLKNAIAQILSMDLTTRPLREKYNLSLT